jgi:hypothetical protein
MIPSGLFNAQQVARNQDKHVGMRKSVKRDDLPMPLHYDVNNVNKIKGFNKVRWGFFFPAVKVVFVLMARES